MENKTLTGVRKRQKIDQTNKQMMFWVAGAAAAVTICAMLAINLFGQIKYQAKIISKKSETSETLKTSLDAISTLTKNINTLQTDQNLLALRADTDDTAFNVVIDALPTEDDATALGSSIQEKVLVGSGVSLESFEYAAVDTSATSGATDTTKSTSSIRPEAKAITFRFKITGSYDAIKAALVNIEKTIRPIIIQSLNIDGTVDNLTATISATTYYVPRVHYAVGQETILPDGVTASDGTDSTSEGSK